MKKKNGSQPGTLTFEKVLDVFNEYLQQDPIQTVGDRPRRVSGSSGGSGGAVMAGHALLSASSAHRWMNCPPSARLCESYTDKGSEYAQEGTDAHSLCEHKLKLALGMATTDPTEHLTFYNEEMETCAEGYTSFVMELMAEARKNCKDPVVLIEQRLDFSRFVQEGFGTGDCVIIADGTLYIVDYKHGKGVEVSAVDNPQMMLYAMGALEMGLVEDELQPQI